MTKYNFHEHTDNELYEWAFAETVGFLTDTEMEQVDPHAIDISLTIEGKEVNFLKFTDRFFAQIEHLAKSEAERIVREALGEIEDCAREKPGAMVVQRSEKG